MSLRYFIHDKETFQLKGIVTRFKYKYGEEIWTFFPDKLTPHTRARVKDTFERCIPKWVGDLKNCLIVEENNTDEKYGEIKKTELQIIKHEVNLRSKKEKEMKELEDAKIKKDTGTRYNGKVNRKY